MLHPMPAVEGLGELTREDDAWMSAPVACPVLGGLAVRFRISVDHENDPYAQPDIQRAILRFLAIGGRDRLVATERVHANYEAFLDVADIDALPLTSPADIWRFVQPNLVRIEIDDPTRKVYVVIDCECDWEVEHGLQLVYLGGDQLVRVSEQDGHFTGD